MGFYTHGSGAGLAGQPASFSKRMNSFSRLVVFQVEDGRYGVRFEDVERVVAAVELVPLPDAPDLVLGVFNLQGNVVPAIDTRLRLRLPSRELPVSDQFLAVRAAGRVEPVRRLVQHQEIGRGGEQLGQQQTVLFTTRKRLDRSTGPLGLEQEVLQIADDVAALVHTLANKLQRRTTSDSFYSAGMSTCMTTCKTSFHMVVLL